MSKFSSPWLLFRGSIGYRLPVLCFSAAFLWLLAPWAVAQTNPGWLQGTWYGVGYQLDGRTWDVVLEVGNRSIEVEYPTLGCSGKWTLSGEDEFQASGTEKILRGKSNCDVTVQLRITLVTRNEINVSYMLNMHSVEGRQQRVVAFSNLMKSGGPSDPLPVGIYQQVD